MVSLEREHHRQDRLLDCMLLLDENMNRKLAWNEITRAISQTYSSKNINAYYQYSEFHFNAVQ